MSSSIHNPIEHIELDFGWDKTFLHVITLKKPLDPNKIAIIDRQYPECTIIGVTDDVTPCKVGLALLYTQEDIVTKRARVKNLTLLLLLNIYGFKQIKDLLDNVKHINKIIIINCDFNNIKSIISSLNKVLGENLPTSTRDSASSRPRICKSEELYSITSNRLDVILK